MFLSQIFLALEGTAITNVARKSKVQLQVVVLGVAATGAVAYQLARWHCTYSTYSIASSGGWK